MKIKFTELYKGAIEENKYRFEKLKLGFVEEFGADNIESLQFFSAPGRTEIGGNHTDHNHGRVLAAAVNLDIIGAVKKRNDDKIYLKSAGYNKVDVIDLSSLEVNISEKEKSAALIRGICARCKELGFNIGGFEAYTISNVLKGSGLSSSAAFEILVVTIISHLYNDGKIDAVTAALISKYAENVYFGKPSGLMDQMASSVGGFTAIDFKDDNNPIIEKIDFNLQSSGYALCIVDTKGNHADLTSDYAAIPNEMKQVAEFFGKQYLREVDEAEFIAKIPEIRKIAGDRAVLRVIHFFNEDRIADEEAKVLKDGDFEQFKKLVQTSGFSSVSKLQNIFSTSAPQEQGLSLALAITERILIEQGAFRVHGGGFAGTIQAFVPFDMLDKYKSEIEKIFGENSCYVLEVRNVGGTKIEF